MTGYSLKTDGKILQIPLHLDPFNFIHIFGPITSFVFSVVYNVFCDFFTPCLLQRNELSSFDYKCTCMKALENLYTKDEISPF